MNQHKAPDRPRAPLRSSIDETVLDNFWERRAEHPLDPRSVTLTRVPRAAADASVELSRAWLRRNLRALGCSPRRVLDLACGNGDWTIPFAQEADEVVAVDRSKGFVEACRSRAERMGVGARLRIVWSHAASFDPPGGFDLVVLGSFTQYLTDEDLELVLDRAARAVLPGGVLYLRTTVCHKPELAVICCGEDYRAIYRPESIYVRALEERGLKVMRTTTAATMLAETAAFSAPATMRPFVRRVGTAVVAMVEVATSLKWTRTVAWLAQRPRNGYG